VRKVILEGEAYFDVTENKEKPFIVTTRGYDVTVLGTSFNLMAYADEETVVTTLVEGSVEITSSKEKALIAPGQQAVLNTKTNGLSVNNVDTYQYTAWKEGVFEFRSETLESITRKLSRWYNCQFYFSDTEIKQLCFTGSVSKHKDMTKLLNIISQSCNIEFEVDENKTIIINKFEIIKHLQKCQKVNIYS